MLSGLNELFQPSVLHGWIFPGVDFFSEGCNPSFPAAPGQGKASATKDLPAAQVFLNHVDVTLLTGTVKKIFLRPKLRAIGSDRLLKAATERCNSLIPSSSLE